MASVLRFRLRRSLLDKNADEIERALVRRSQLYREWQEKRRLWEQEDDAVHQLREEREGLLIRERASKAKG